MRGTIIVRTRCVTCVELLINHPTHWHSDEYLDKLVFSPIKRLDANIHGIIIFTVIKRDKRYLFSISIFYVSMRINFMPNISIMQVIMQKLCREGRNLWCFNRFHRFKLKLPNYHVQFYLSGKHFFFHLR